MCHKSFELEHWICANSSGCDYEPTLTSTVFEGKPKLTTFENVEKLGAKIPAPQARGVAAVARLRVW